MVPRTAFQEQIKPKLNPTESKKVVQEELHKRLPVPKSTPKTGRLVVFALKSQGLTFVL